MPSKLAALAALALLLGCAAGAHAAGTFTDIKYSEWLVLSFLLCLGALLSGTDRAPALHAWPHAWQQSPRPLPCAPLATPRCGLRIPPPCLTQHPPLPMHRSLPHHLRRQAGLRLRHQQAPWRPGACRRAAIHCAGAWVGVPCMCASECASVLHPHPHSPHHQRRRNHLVSPPIILNITPSL